VILVADDFVTSVATLSHGQYVYEVARQMLLAARTQLEIPDDMIILDIVHVPYDDVATMVQNIDQKLASHIAGARRGLSRT
jgi:hypothetical protein